MVSRFEIVAYKSNAAVGFLVNFSLLLFLQAQRPRSPQAARERRLHGPGATGGYGSFSEVCDGTHLIDEMLHVHELLLSLLGRERLSELSHRGI